MIPAEHEALASSSYLPYGTSTLNPLPNFVEEVEDYSKINLTTIKGYIDSVAVRPITNVSVVGRMNNAKVRICDSRTTSTSSTKSRKASRKKRTTCRPTSRLWRSG